MAERFKFYLTLTIGAMSLLVYGSGSADCSKISKELDTIIVEHLAELRGTQYCTHTYRNQQVEIVLYFVEGACFSHAAPAGSCGDRTSSFVAGYAPGSRLAPLQIGASGDFVPKKITLDQDTLIVSGAGYAETDPPCCPTLETQRRVRITPSGFILTTP